VRHGLRTAFAILIALAVCPLYAGAQTDSRPPSGSVFGGAGTGSKSSLQNLNIMISVAEAYDQDVTDRTSGVDLQIFQGRGSYTTLTPQMDFKSGGDRFQVGITAGSSVRYYGDLHETIVVNHAIGAGFNVQLTPRTSVFLNEGVTYSPALFYGLFASTSIEPAAGDTVPAAPNYVLNSKRSYVYDSKASLTHKISERAALVFNAGFQYQDYTGHDVAYPDLRTEDAGGHFLYSLNRDVKLRLGYTFKQGQFLGAPRTDEHDLDIGVDYSRPLSRTRRSTITVSLGPTIANGALSQVRTLDVGRQYRLTANMALIHQIGRTWTAQASYRRGMGYYVEGFAKPVFSEAYAASTSGFLNRRTDVSLTAAYSTGESALTGAPDQFATYTGDARVRFGLGKIWATYVEYLFYYYKFNSGIQLPAGVPPYLTRNGVRTGLTLWVPVRHR
jgi:hypothetical protein